MKKLENSLMLLIKEGFEISDIGANGLFAGYSVKGQPKKTQLVKSSSQTYVNISITIKGTISNILLITSSGLIGARTLGLLKFNVLLRCACLIKNIIMH